MRLNGVGLYSASEAHKRAKSRNLRIIVQTVSSNRALILEKLPFIPLFLLMKGSQTSSRADFVLKAASVTLPLQHDLVIVLIYTHFPSKWKYPLIQIWLLPDTNTRHISWMSKRLMMPWLQTFHSAVVPNVNHLVSRASLESSNSGMKCLIQDTSPGFFFVVVLFCVCVLFIHIYIYINKTH